MLCQSNKFLVIQLIDFRKRRASYPATLPRAVEADLMEGGGMEGGTRGRIYGRYQPGGPTNVPFNIGLSLIIDF